MANKTNPRVRIHQFCGMVAINFKGQETVYFSPEKAKEFAQVLQQFAENPGSTVTIESDQE